MVVSGFLAYSSEALFFVHDPINIIKETHRPFYHFFKFIYNNTVLIVLLYLLYLSVKIQIKSEKIEFKDKILIYFSLYFFFTINLFILTGNTFIFFQNGERAHLVITISNLYILLLQYLYQITKESIGKINSYVKVEFSDTSETDLNIVRLGEKDYNDDSLEMSK